MRVNNHFFDYILILTGSLLLAISVEVFFLPLKISCGGISSVGTVLFYLFKIPLSVTNMVLNVILFAFAVKLLGKASLRKTIFGILMFTLWLEIVAYVPGYSADLFVATLFGGITLGVGIGLVVRAGGSTGGSDLAGLIINKNLPHISVPKIIFLVDAIIIVISGLVFKSFTIIVYSATALFVSAKIGDAVICIGNSAKQILIISDNTQKISSDILSHCQRGVTGLFCKGMYSGEKRIALMCIVSPREVPKIMDIIKNIDEESFVVITDVREVLGEGFKSVNI